MNFYKYQLHSWRRKRSTKQRTVSGKGLIKVPSRNVAGELAGCLPLLKRAKALGAGSPSALLATSIGTEHKTFISARYTSITPSSSNEAKNGETLEFDSSGCEISFLDARGNTIQFPVDTVTIDYTQPASLSSIPLDVLTGTSTHTIAGTFTLMPPATGNPGPEGSGSATSSSSEIDWDFFSPFVAPLRVGSDSNASVSFGPLASTPEDLPTPPANPGTSMERRAAGGGVPERRFKRIRMAISELFEVLKTGHIATLSSVIPRTAEICNVRYSKESNYFELVIEDESFPLVRECDAIPLIAGPTFGVFEVEWQPLRDLLENHDACRELVSSLAPEYATQRQLAAVTPRSRRLEGLDERE